MKLRYIRFVSAVVMGIALFFVTELWLFSSPALASFPLEIPASSADNWGNPVTAITDTTFVVYQQDFV